MAIVIQRRYELVREIASGAMGAVYEAVDRERGDRVAVKLLRADLRSDTGLARRLRREASILRLVEHPAIVRILDAGEDASSAFVVMELISGETLEARLARRGALSLEQAAPLLVELARALEAAHRHGIVHGDVKPANIFLTSIAPYVKLVDFGLSKVEGLDRLTRTGEIAGTPIYMAPELFDGSAIDARLDLYALGVVAYQALAGAPPFDARKHPGQLLSDIAMGRFAPLGERAPRIPIEVQRAIEHAMAADRERRPADAAALASTWERALAPAR